MADIINLNKIRKAKRKQGEAARAVENRIRYGIATIDRRVEKARQKKEAQKHDNHIIGTKAHNKNVDAPE